jgi:L-serine dehydratase
MATQDKFDGSITNEDPLGSTADLVAKEIPPGVDRRTFIMRSAVIGAATVVTGRVISAPERTLKAFAESLERPQGPGAPPLDKNLSVVKKGQGPVLTVIDEFYKVGPGLALSVVLC